MNGRPGMAARVLALIDAGEDVKGTALKLKADESYVRATLRRHGYRLVRTWQKPTATPSPASAPRSAPR